MRLATRAVAALLVIGLLLAGALVIAELAIGPPDPAPVTATSATSRTGAENWKTHSSLFEGIPVAISLGADFVRAWLGMTGIGWLVAAGAVAVFALVIYLFRRLLRRHAKGPLPV
jgi:hypothetical protein